MRKSGLIPVNPMVPDSDTGIFVRKISSTDFHLYHHLQSFEGIRQSHRDEYHLFLLQEEGTTTIEVDFNSYVLKPFSVFFVLQNQVHRIVEFQDAVLSMCAIHSEDLLPEYLKLMQDISPAKPLDLEGEAFSLMTGAVSLCLDLSGRKGEKLHHSLLAGSCNTLIGLVLSQYLEESGPIEKFSRAEVLTKAFKELLEGNYRHIKRPAVYALQLNVSVNYLNECVKNTTGQSVSHHIQQRVMLEAKRLLFHSEWSVKEISSHLGYDDYPYFSRLFTKIAGISALAFRNKNVD